MARGRGSPPQPRSARLRRMPPDAPCRRPGALRHCHTMTRWTPSTFVHPRAAAPAVTNDRTRIAGRAPSHDTVPESRSRIARSVHTARWPASAIPAVSGRGRWVVSLVTARGTAAEDLHALPFEFRGRRSSRTRVRSASPAAGAELSHARHHASGCRALLATAVAPTADSPTARVVTDESLGSRRPIAMWPSVLTCRALRWDCVAPSGRYRQSSCSCHDAGQVDGRGFALAKGRTCCQLPRRAAEVVMGAASGGPGGGPAVAVRRPSARCL